MESVFKKVAMTITVFLMLLGVSFAQSDSTSHPTTQPPPKQSLNYDLPTIDEGDSVEVIANKLADWNVRVMGIVTIVFGYVFRLIRKTLSEEKKLAIQKWTALIIFLGSSVFLVAKSAISGAITPVQVFGIAVMVLGSIGVHTTLIKPLENMLKRIFNKEASKLQS